MSMPRQPWTSVDILWYSLANSRPDGSEAIKNLVSRLTEINPQASAYVDKAGNLWIDTRNNGETTMFMAHLDTVESQEGTKILYFSPDRKVVHTGGIAVLGADDGAGIGVLAAMIEANVPALYLFSQGEETGGHGAKHAAMNEYPRLDSIQRCISFDRKGTAEICGAQWIGNLASRQFVEALSDKIGLGHVWGTGTYTDNSEFAGQIQEIVNVSVGYGNNHGPDETLDYAYWLALRDACISCDWESLPTIGPEAEVEVETWSTYRPGDWEAPAADGIVEETAWDICDALGLEPGSWEADMVRSALEHMADALAPVHEAVWR